MVGRAPIIIFINRIHIFWEGSETVSKKGLIPILSSYTIMPNGKREREEREERGEGREREERGEGRERRGEGREGGDHNTAYSVS